MLSDEVYSQMKHFKHHFDKGIYYGMGMMAFDFGELSPLLKLSGLTTVYGTVGSTGTYALYDKEGDTLFIGATSKKMPLGDHMVQLLCFHSCAKPIGSMRNTFPLLTA